MNEEQVEHVFDRFWRADPSRARTLGGTGLGLSISASDAHLHGGWLQAWGQEGEGAVFRLTLPRRPGTELVRSPLRLERPFDRTLADAAVSPTPTGEIRIGPDLLPDLDTTDLDHPAVEDAAARHPEGEGPAEDDPAEEKDAGAR